MELETGDSVACADVPGPAPQVFDRPSADGSKSAKQTVFLDEVWCWFGSKVLRALLDSPCSTTSFYKTTQGVCDDPASRRDTAVDFPFVHADSGGAPAQTVTVVEPFGNGV